MLNSNFLIVCLLFFEVTASALTAGTENNSLAFYSEYSFAEVEDDSELDKPTNNGNADIVRLHVYYFSVLSTRNVIYLTSILFSNPQSRAPPLNF